MKAAEDYRPSTLAERREYYLREFPLKKAMSWFKGRPLPQLAAVDAGTETGIIADERYRNKLLYFPLKDLRGKLRKYAPEDVYYDRNIYADPKRILETFDFKDCVCQELAFDIDADNIPCPRHPPGQVCGICIGKAYKWALKMRAKLDKDFRGLYIVYSGRGFHVHVTDEKAYSLGVREREMLNRRFRDYPIDPWVSRGYISLIRLPYTLNGIVSRIAAPIGPKKGFIAERTRPRFLGG
jgi:DNA primase catalytic subunit